MKTKVMALLIVATSILVASCHKDEKPVFPTVMQVSGAWKLARIEKDDQPVDFNDYPLPMAAYMKNMYFLFLPSNEFSLVINQTASLSRYAGIWNLSNDNLHTLDGAPSGALHNYKIRHFEQGELIITENSFPDYNLVFESMVLTDFPEVYMSATVQQQPFVTESVNAYSQSPDRLELNAQDFNLSRLQIIIHKPDLVVAGQTYSFDQENIFAKYSVIIDEAYHYYHAVEGEITVRKISDEYVDITFNITLQDDGGNEINFADGVYQSIIIPQ